MPGPGRPQPTWRQMVDAGPDYTECERHDAFQRHPQDHRRYLATDADRHAPYPRIRRPCAPQSLSRSAAPRGILPHGNGHDAHASYPEPGRLGTRTYGRDSDQPGDGQRINNLENQPFPRNGHRYGEVPIALPEKRIHAFEK